MTLTPYQTQIYFDAFHIPVEKVVFNNTIFYYTINGMEMKLYYTLLDSSHITQDFVEYCFREFHINKITVKACFCDSPISLKRTTRLKSLDDNILMLYEYEDIEQYLKELGKKTRQHLRYYKRKFDAYVQSEKAVFEKKILLPKDEMQIWENVCEKIYELNEQRCITKGFHSGTPKEWITICNKIGGGCFIILIILRL